MKGILFKIMNYKVLFVYQDKTVKEADLPRDSVSQLET